MTCNLGPCEAIPTCNNKISQVCGAYIGVFMHKKALLLVGVLVVASLASVAKAEPEFLDTLTAKYNIKDDSALGQKSCGICHISEDDYHFNPYGKQLADYLTDHNLKTVTNEVLDAVGKMNATGVGGTNDEKLKAGQAPGQAPPGAKPAPAGPAAPAKPKPLIPKNGFHPAIVHFPIALLIAGIFLDFYGLIRRRPNFLAAGWYNLVLAAISSLGAVGSGLYAMTVMKLPYKGLIFTHLKLALLATVLMWIMVALRVHRHEKMQVGLRVLYYILATGAFLAIAIAGHLGGSFVYGD